jgi:hypothetical protein
MKITDHYRFKQEYRFYDQDSNTWMTEEKCLEHEKGIDCIYVYFTQQMVRRPILQSVKAGLRRGYIPRGSNEESKEEQY